MSNTPQLDWKGFIEYCIEVDDIDVLETNEEKSFITIHNLANTDPLVVAEMFIIAADSGIYVGAFHAEKRNGAVDFYP